MISLLSMTALLNCGMLWYQPLVANAGMKNFHVSSKAEHDQAMQYLNMARNSAKVGEYALAVGHYTKAIALDNTLGVYAERGWCRYQQGDYDEAERDADTAIKHKYSEGGLAELVRGKCAFAKGGYAQAAKDIVIAIENGTFSEEDIKTVAVCYEQLGQYEEALPYYFFFLSIDRNDEFAVNGIERVRSILFEKIDNYYARLENPVFVEPEVFDVSSPTTAANGNYQTSAYFDTKEASADTYYLVSGQNYLSDQQPIFGTPAETSIAAIADSTMQSAVQNITNSIEQLRPVMQEFGAEGVEALYQAAQDYHNLNLSGKMSFSDYVMAIGDKYSDSMLGSYQPYGEALDRMAEKFARFCGKDVNSTFFTDSAEIAGKLDAPSPSDKFIGLYEKYTGKERKSILEEIGGKLFQKKSIDAENVIFKSAKGIISVVGKISTVQTNFKILQLGNMEIKEMGKAQEMLSGQNFHKDIKNFVKRVFKVDIDDIFKEAESSEERDFPFFFSDHRAWMEDHSNEVHQRQDGPKQYNYNGKLIFFKKKFHGGFGTMETAKPPAIASIVRLDDVNGCEWGGTTELRLSPVWNEKVKCPYSTSIRMSVKFGKPNKLVIDYCGKQYEVGIAPPSANYVQTGVDVLGGNVYVYGHIEAMRTGDGIVIRYKDCYGTLRFQLVSHNFEKGFETKVFGVDMNCDVYMYR